MNKKAKHLDETFVKRLGLSLYIYRQRKGFSLSQICNLLDIKVPTFCSYENGRREIDIESLKYLSQHYEVSIDKIVKNNPLDFLWEDFKNAQTTDKKDFYAKIIKDVFYFMDKNGKGKCYSSWWMNEANSMLRDVLKYEKNKK